MKIGIDCRTISDAAGQPTGVSMYTTQLVSALLDSFPEHQFVLFSDNSVSEDRPVQWSFDHHDNAEFVFFPFSEHKKYLPLVHSHWMVARMLKRHKLDVFHEPANSVPLGYGGPSVVTVHDLAIFEHPEWFPDSQLLSRKVLIPKTMEKVQHIIAVSQATSEQLQRILKVPAERISVVPEGINHVVAPSDAIKRERPYVLYVGTIEPRKNLARLLQAFDRMLTQHPHLQEVELVLAGKMGWKTEDFEKALAGMKHKENVQQLGYVSYDEKAALMRDAELFVFPSLDEGFGLPPLEAASLKTAVLVANRGALPEVVAPDMPMVDPEDIDAIADGMAVLLNEDQLRSHIAQMGYEHSKSYTWQRVAEATMDVYNQVVATKA
jgi:glycosyltransferase involved in cell wall biosynthesis